MRAEEWDERYAERQQWSTEPNALVADLLSDLPAGDAVDLAAGEGRHALWLARRGWGGAPRRFCQVSRSPRREKAGTRCGSRGGAGGSPPSTSPTSGCPTGGENPAATGSPG